MMYSLVFAMPSVYVMCMSKPIACELSIAVRLYACCLCVCVRCDYYCFYKVTVPSKTNHTRQLPQQQIVTDQKGRHDRQDGSTAGTMSTQVTGGLIARECNGLSCNSTQ